MTRAIFISLLLCCGCGISTVRARDASAPPADSTINLRRTVTVEVVEKTKDAVVNISTTKLINRRVAPFGFDPFWQQFGQGAVERVPANSLGSGFIVHPDGYVITNNHVIDRAREIHVELADGRKLPAELISADAEADLAVLKIQSDKPFPTLDLGDSSDLMIGEPVIAIGNPLGYSHSVSTGIVSAVHRDLKDPNGKVTLADLIQTDAAINPGNSGGPLLNAYGQVIGINTAIRSDAQNIGFSIPINRLRDLIPELMNPAQVRKVDVKLKLAEKRTITPPATVTSEIDTAGAHPRRVSAINGRVPRDIIDAYAMLLRANVGQTITLSFGPKEAPEKTVAAAMPTPDAIVQAKKILGLTVEQMTPMLAEKYHLSAEDGLFVSAVAKDSISAKAGVQAGDIIISFGRYRVATLNDLSVVLHRLPESGQVRIGVLRGDQVGAGILEF
ncbi:MAG TPA: trypsin-like peptidase domain-containing protein [Tepidisphaeraceae bacterium]|jgi:serine protease Do|nr:trypsin-like peptidase domain-containing protein [Tepidisphaeraceae bacterium]